MSMDTRNSIIAIIGAAVFGAVILVALVGMILLAWAHDGQLAQEAFSTFGQILAIALPSLAAIFGLDRLVTGYVANKQIAATSTVQTTALQSGATSVPSVPNMPAPLPAPAPVTVTVPITTSATPSAAPVSETLASTPGNLAAVQAAADALPSGGAL